MSDKLPFEDAFKNKMNDLPTGNEDASWQKMKQLLEEKEKRKPFAWLNIYTVCSFIIILAGFSIWIILYDTTNKHKNTDTTENTSVAGSNKISNEQSKPNENISKIKPGETNKVSIQKNKANTISKQMNAAFTELNATQGEHISLHKNNGLKDFDKQSSTQANETNNINFATDTNKTLVAKKENNDAISATGLDSLQNVNNNNQSISKNNPASEKMEPSLSATGKNDLIKIETNAANNLNQPSNFDTAVKKQSPISLKKKQFFVEAGIQIKQQIPLGGQKIIGYNYTDDKNLISDYIPSVFVKFEKGYNWFIKGEFNYATPYYVKQFTYSQKTTADYKASTVSVTKANLQKIYYTQIPVSFNYYFKPKWSVGAGFSYNWFRGAVAEQETTINNFKTGTQTISKQNIYFKNFTDSFLYKSSSSLFFQTGYSLKRWSLTLQYSKNLQPFVKYTLPDGTIDSKRNASLNLLIGYSFLQRPLSKNKK